MYFGLLLSFRFPFAVLPDNGVAGIRLRFAYALRRGGSDAKLGIGMIRLRSIPVSLQKNWITIAPFSLEP